MEQRTDIRPRLVKTAYVSYFHTDLAKTRQFLEDFGLHAIEEGATEDTVYFQGYGTEPYCYVAQKSTNESNEFGGAAFVVESREELNYAARIKGATQIRPLNAPGGGEIVTVHDPMGFPLHLVYGQSEKLALDVTPVPLPKLVVNYEEEKPRQGKFQRFVPGPAPVHRWGHFGVTYTEGQFQNMCDWYTQNLNFAVSDVVYVGEKPVTCFFHIDRGEIFTDHHAFFIKRAPPGKTPNVAHAAFEVHDFDIQQLGHDHLKAQGYELCWGVGRVS